MASIVTRRLLRTGQGGFTADTAGLVDEWLIRVDEQIDKFQLLEIWVLDGNLPIPKFTFRGLGTNFVVCDRVDGECVGAQRYLWKVRVAWKEISQSESNDQTRPVPTVDSPDPQDWRPKVTRRPVTVQLPAKKLFYEEGYGGTIHTNYLANTNASTPARSSFTNSAEVAFEDQLPPHQRRQWLWTIRWLRTAVPVDLVNAELTINSKDVTFKHQGYTEVWVKKSAKLESVQLTETRWGNQDLWEITVEVLVDADGHFIEREDKGRMELYRPGEPLPGGTSALVMEHLNIKTKTGEKVSEDVFLDGTGKKLETDVHVYGKWRDFPLVDFGTLGLLKDLLS